MLIASPGRCEEASPLSHQEYIPCNAPATRMIENRGERYRMCPACADHNVKNRGAKDVGPYEGSAAEGAAAPAITADEFAAYAADAPQADLSSGDLLTRISATVREIMKARSEVTEAEEFLKLKQKAVRNLEEFTLPELMNEAGQKTLTTVDDFIVELDETLRASIPKASEPEAFQWMADHGQAAIIKREVKIGFGMGEDTKATETVALLTSKGLVPSDKRSIHPQTLLATLRELLASGIDVPLPLFGGYVQPIVKIKDAKTKKKV